MINKISLDRLCASLSQAMGIKAPAEANPSCKEFVDLVDEKLGGEKVERVIMYNPDAIGQWIFEKYNHMFQEIVFDTDLALSLSVVMPSVTPVCFGTMYTGAMKLMEKVVLTDLIWKKI